MFTVSVPYGNVDGNNLWINEVIQYLNVPPAAAPIDTIIYFSKYEPLFNSIKC